LSAFVRTLVLLLCTVADQRRRVFREVGDNCQDFFKSQYQSGK